MVRGLAPLIRAWPGEGGHQRAVTGLDVLAAIGTDVALLHLSGIANKAKFKGLKARAQDKIVEVAAGLGLSAEQLADRLVPDFGLDADGGLVLDYGPRSFVVGFDEQLKPSVADADGKRRKDLPKPGAKDDQELAQESHKRFAALKKDVRTVAGDQIARLERAMVTQRRWTGREFLDLFAAHPLLWHLARRVVWGLYDDGGALLRGFRLAEDRTAADVEDDALTVADDAVVGIAHPLHLGAAVEAWSEVFADYEVLQPFSQLGRPVFALTEQEHAATELTRFRDVTVPVGRVLSLIRRGWARGVPQDAGVEPWILKPLPGNRTVVLNLDPGIAVGAIDVLPEQTLDHLWLSRGRGGDWWPSAGSVSFAELDAVSASELLADLTELTGR